MQTTDEMLVNNKLTKLMLQWIIFISWLVTSWLLLRFSNIFNGTEHLEITVDTLSWYTIYYCKCKILDFLLSPCPTDTEYLKWIFPECMKKTVFRICYNGIGQKVSVCDYWNGKNRGGGGFILLERMKTYVFFADPHQRSRYLKSNSFLAVLDGDRPHNSMKGNELLSETFCAV